MGYLNQDVAKCSTYAEWNAFGTEFSDETNFM
jgi:hypothetical protein